MHRCTEDEDVTCATMRALWETAHARYLATHAATGPAPLSFAKNGDTGTVPVCIPNGLWHLQVNRYNSITVAGQNRKFPEAILAGADRTLARVHHEHTTSKHYTPMSLSEITSTRSINALVVTNPESND